MATSPNFGWLEPDNTDLVKNGALAIRTAVNAIDASMAELKGGTTGQVLSKTSATDMDFTWTTPSTPAGYAENGVLNSAFNIWQRGTSVSGAGGGAYTADRWFLYAGGQGTVSRQVTGDTTNLPNIQYCARVQRNSGSSDTTNLPFIQSFETLNSVQYAGKTVTLSFYARKGANYSPTASGLVVTLATGTGTDQNYESAGYTGGATPISQTATLTTTWQRFSYSATLASTTTEVTTRFVTVPTGTAGAADYYEITGVQLEIGSTATAYHPNQTTYEAELAACQRYYWRSTAGANYSVFGGNCSAWSTTDLLGGFNLPVTMRTNPTSVQYSSLIASDGVNNNSVGTLTFSSAYSSPNVGGFSATSTSLTAFRFYRIQANNSSSAYIAYSAEI